jgi:hypothetical protein
MKLNELIGKKVLRTAPNRKGDRSYMSTDSIIEIISIIDGVPLAQDVNTKEIIELTTYDDDNWIDFTDIYDKYIENN